MNPSGSEFSPFLKEWLEHLYLHHDTKDVSEIFAEERASFAKGAITEALTCKKSLSLNMTEKIDALLIHKFFGIPNFHLFNVGALSTNLCAWFHPYGLDRCFFCLTWKLRKNNFW